MKIGILTYQNTHNYGANLQLKALKLYLEKNNYEVMIINYINKNIEKSYPKIPKYEFDIKNFKNIITSIVNFGIYIIKFIYSYKTHIKKYKKFEKYLDKLIGTPKIYDLNEISSLDLDFIICGSDQIWNPVLTNGLDGAYFCDFKTSATKIAYAASMGLKKLPEIEEQNFEKLINNFDFISVREKSLKVYAAKFTKKEIEVVLDPTLLLEASDYEKFVKKPNYDNYVLIYTLSEDKKLLTIAKELAKKEKLQIIEIRFNKSIKHIKNKQICDADPDEFLGYIKYASKIVTNSFHGTIFSILFKKDFYILKSDWGSSRLETLLNICGMTHRYINSLTDIKNNNQLDFDKAFENIYKNREVSMKFLNKSLQKKV